MLVMINYHIGTKTWYNLKYLCGNWNFSRINWQNHTIRKWNRFLSIIFFDTHYLYILYLSITLVCQSFEPKNISGSYKLRKLFALFFYLEWAL